MFKTISLKDISTSEAHNFLHHAIAPRPVCFASTIDSKNNVNLSPFSFFNLFSTHPPIIIFSPSRRLRDNTTKHTLQNILEVPEVVVNMVSFEMVQQASLSSCEFSKGVDEFIKAGFTKMASETIRPPRVSESPVQMECKVIEVKSLGDGGGAGNLVIAEIVLMHVNENILSADGKIDQQKLELVARLGGNWYAKINAGNLFEVSKPGQAIAIGIDQLPESIKTSEILTGNHLAKLAGVHELPDVDPSFYDDNLKNIFQYYSLDPQEMEKELHLYASSLLNEGNLAKAWQVLLALA